MDVASRLGGQVGAFLVAAARDAFVSGVDLALRPAAAVVLAGCLIALAALPSRPGPPPETSREEGGAGGAERSGLGAQEVPSRAL